MITARRRGSARLVRSGTISFARMQLSHMYVGTISVNFCLFFLVFAVFVSWKYRYAPLIGNDDQSVLAASRLSVPVAALLRER